MGTFRMTFRAADAPSPPRRTTPSNHSSPSATSHHFNTFLTAFLYIIAPPSNSIPSDNILCIYLACSSLINSSNINLIGYFRHSIHYYKSASVCRLWLLNFAEWARSDDYFFKLCTQNPQLRVHSLKMEPYIHTAAHTDALIVEYNLPQQFAYQMQK